MEGNFTDEKDNRIICTLFRCNMKENVLLGRSRKIARKSFVLILNGNDHP